MKTFCAALLIFILTAGDLVYAQKFVDKVKFFQDTSIVNATLTFNMQSLFSRKFQVGLTVPATFVCKSGDTLNVDDHILLAVRGHMRREHCDMPPLKLIYKNNPAAAFYRLKTLKLVNACASTNDYDQYILKEYACYKMYNLISDMSLRARLLNLTYKDSSRKKKPLTRHAFLLEEPKEMAKRNNCVQFTARKISSDQTNHSQMTLLGLFEYMIGNTDWGVTFNHNIILMVPKTDSVSPPLPVGYDFDYSGMVNTDYAAPDPKLGNTSVRQRVYRGYPRTMDELNAALSVFKHHKMGIYALVADSKLLSADSKTEMKSYLDDFYDIIDNPRKVKETFITNARKN
jgi:hypothetical protein